MAGVFHLLIMSENATFELVGSVLENEMHTPPPPFKVAKNNVPKDAHVLKRLQTFFRFFLFN